LCLLLLVEPHYTLAAYPSLRESREHGHTSDSPDFRALGSSWHRSSLNKVGKISLDRIHRISGHPAVIFSGDLPGPDSPDFRSSSGVLQQTGFAGFPGIQRRHQELLSKSLVLVFKIPNFLLTVLSILL